MKNTITEAHLMARKRFAGLLLIGVMLFVPAVTALAEDSAAVQKVLATSFALDGQDAVIASLVSASAKQTVPADKKRILAVLADYEERLGLSDAASKHYNAAAFADSTARDDALLLDSARCALISNDVTQADGLVRAVLLTSFDDRQLLRARVYAAWIQLSSGDVAGALPLLRGYSQNAVFSEYTPSILFTLWWVDTDQAARSRLLSQYASSPEAAIVRGEMALSPVPFWYLMPKKESLVADFARDGNKALDLAAADGSAPASPVKTEIIPATGTASVVPVAGQVWQQVGFFKNREYADELVGQLKTKGFNPVIRNETRPSGTVYFVVIVAENQERTVGARLKDAGFESFLLTE